MGFTMQLRSLTEGLLRMKLRRANGRGACPVAIRQQADVVLGCRISSSLITPSSRATCMKISSLPGNNFSQNFPHAATSSRRLPAILHPCPVARRF